MVRGDIQPVLEALLQALTALTAAIAALHDQLHQDCTRLEALLTQIAQNTKSSKTGKD